MLPLLWSPHQQREKKKRKLKLPHSHKCLKYFHLLHTRLFNIMLHLAFTFESLPSYNSSSPPTNSCASAFYSLCSHSLFHFQFFSSTIYSLHHQVQLCHSLMLSSAVQKSSEKDGEHKLKKKENCKQSLPPGSMSQFLARQYMTILPLCDWRTSGTEWQSGGQKKSHSRSRCLLPLDICPWDGAGRMGNGEEGRE